MNAKRSFMLLQLPLLLLFYYAGSPLLAFANVVALSPETAENSTGHSRFIATLTVLKEILAEQKATLAELKAINGKMTSPSSSNSSLLQQSPSVVNLTTEAVTAPPPLTKPFILVSPNSQCPLAFRKRLLAGLNFRRAEEGLPLLKENFSLGREAYALASGQQSNIGSPFYLAEYPLYGQYAAGMLHDYNSDINLQWFDFFARWKGIPVIFDRLGTDNQTVFKALPEQKWAKTTQVGLACDASLLSTSYSRHKFWVGAFFSGFA